ncbi:MarR family transcriptional regulator [Thermus thalpophilus]|uniref:MarR family transcriptional regulator n=1 Tax=Thermus thalpophilus TaxID=2908147 RepID=UPI001FAADB3F|nr:helix-turn-helix domain-containing protein [Thermus thalpophilus]
MGEYFWHDLIRELLATRAITQNDIARFLMIDKGYFSRLMRDPERLEAFMDRYPDLHKKRALARALNDRKTIQDIRLEGYTGERVASKTTLFL